MARILLSMNDEFLKTIDKFAKREQRNRSELIREALRSYIKKANIASPEKANKDASILENLMD